MYSVTAGAVLDFVFNLDLIPKFGADGAAFSTLMAEVLVLAIQGFGLHKELKGIVKEIQVWKMHPWTCRGDGNRIFCRSAYQSWRFLYIMCVGTFLFRHIWYNFTDVAGNIRNKYIGVVSEAREEERVNHVPKREKSMAETLGFYYFRYYMFTRFGVFSGI